jgi:MATE family multidrug resistance protein
MFRNRHDSAIFRLALPALGGLAVDPLVSLVDTAFVGQLGTVQLAALGINASLFAFTFIVFNFLAYGTTPRVGRAYGAGDLKSAGRAVVEAFTLAAIAGTAALVALQVFADPILRVMGATGELREPALEYLRIRALAGPAVLFITAGRGTFRGFQNTTTPLRIIVVVNLINLVLDPLLIFGLGWGLTGAATATVVAQWAGALLFAGLIFVRNREAFGIEAHLPTLAELAPFLGVGGKLLIRTGSLVGTMTLATAVAARVGVIEVAAHQVASQMWMFMALAIDALAVAGQALVSKHVGEGEASVAREVSNRLLVLGVAFGFLLAAVFWLVRPYLPGLFSDDPRAVQMVFDIFVFVALLQPLNGLVFVWDGIFMGAEDFGFLAVAMVVSAVIAAGLLLAVVPMGWGLEGVWWAITALMATRIVSLGWRYATRPLS